MDDSEGLKVLEKEGSADVVERVRELELEVEAENVTKLLQSHDEASTDEKMCFLRWNLLLVKML